jgi:hypothetical protein
MIEWHHENLALVSEPASREDARLRDGISDLLTVKAVDDDFQSEPRRCSDANLGRAINQVVSLSLAVTVCFGEGQRVDLKSLERRLNARQQLGPNDCYYQLHVRFLQGASNWRVKPESKKTSRRQLIRRRPVTELRIRRDAAFPPSAGGLIALECRVRTQTERFRNGIAYPTLAGKASCCLSE